jgi:quaternary ammonium compound-resistance protein SugE
MPSFFIGQLAKFPGLIFQKELCYTVYQVNLDVYPGRGVRRTRSGQDDALILLMFLIKELKMSWVFLFIAGLLEVCWAIGLKYTAGFTRLIPSILTIAAITGSMYLLARATETIPIGTAYAVWVGIGAAGAAILGMILFREPASSGKLIFLFLLIVSIIGIKLTSETL